MTSVRITHRRILIRAVGELNPSRRRITLILIRFRPLRAAPGCQETFKIGKAAGIPTVLDVIRQMPPTAVTVIPTLGEKGFEV